MLPSTWPEFGRAVLSFLASPYRVLRVCLALELLFLAGLAGFILGRVS